MRACLLAVALLAALSLPAAHAQKRVLVLLGTAKIESSHSQFFKGLQDNGFKLDIKTVKDEGVKLKNYDDWQYDSLILFAPKATKFGGSIDSKAILDFVDSGNNLVLAAGTDASDTIRSLALECGVELDDKGAAVYDHFHHQAADGASDPTLITTTAVVQSRAIFGSRQPQAPILFKGAAATVPSNADLVSVALSAEPTAYSHDPKKALPDPPTLPVGGSAALVSLVQARNNARVLVAGSLDMFSNEAFDAAVTDAATGQSYDKSGNADFCGAVTLWALQARGVLKVGPLKHYLASDPSNQPSLYRINDDVAVEFDVMLVEGEEEKPFEADDLQISFTMLDPYIRLPMAHDGRGKFKLAFTVPDVYGVFKYSVDYSHLGYSYITFEQTIPVRPFKHDEYERFLVAAYPYYASVLSTMAAFFLLGFAYLYSRP